MEAAFSLCLHTVGFIQKQGNRVPNEVVSKAQALVCKARPTNQTKAKAE